LFIIAFPDFKLALGNHGKGMPYFSDNICDAEVVFVEDGKYEYG
jgi:hypothetical protein